MNHFNNLNQIQLDTPSVVTIGVFDGVHKGHQHLIRQLVDEAHRQGHLAVVLTLFPHPDVVLRGLTGRYYLTTPEQKAALLGDLGVDVVITHPFDDQVRHMRAATFVDDLLSHLHMRGLWVTADFALGYQREGNPQFLAAQGKEKDFELRLVDLVMADGSTISSSHIRDSLLAGDVTIAAASLGRNYRVAGEVIHGDKRGRTIGFPTANLKVWEQQIIPANGVYACWARLGMERFMAVTNIGIRPTFDGQELRIEAHLLDFDRDIYGQTLDLEFVERLRGEQKFPGFEALIQQIGIDAQRGREILSGLSV
ncbi:MAG: bifunctional riboflavin kinase/FAD synthetase [Anaerolineae bacterium]